MTLKDFLHRALVITIAPLLGASVFLVAVFWMHLIDEAKSRELEVAKRVLSAFEKSLSDQIKALQLLASLPEATYSAQYKTLYSGAASFSKLFGGHVILSDTSKQMLINTSVPFGKLLPKMPLVKGRSAFDIALKTGAPAIGDSVVGPVVGVKLIAVAVPVKRDGETLGILLAINKLSRLQSLLDQIAGKSEYNFSVYDSEENLLAMSMGLSDQDWKRQLLGLRSVSETFSLAPWRLEVSSPSPLTDGAFITSCAVLILFTLLAATVSLWSARRLSADIQADVRSLLGDTRFDGHQSKITELEEARQHILEAQKEIQRVSLAKSQFLANMSHELRTPINAILGFGQMFSAVGDTVDASKRKEWIGNIIQGGEHLLGIVTQILDISQIEVDRLRLSVEDISANESVKKCVEQIRIMATDQGIEIEDNFSSGQEIYVRTDPLRLHQILLNLLSNAIKFNRPNGRITINGEKTDRQYFKLYVTDTGVGIPESDRSKLFELFSQVNSDPNIAKSGMGLGLAVSRTLAERLGGWLDYTSELEKGTTFWVSLPLQQNHLAIIWNDEIRLGVNAVDEEHQEIFAAINKLDRVSLSDDEKAEMLSELCSLTADHFHHEEVMMEIVQLPNKTAHREQHQKLLGQFELFFEGWEQSPNRERINELHEFLVKWWASHLKSFDTPLSASIKGRELEIDAKLRLLGKAE